MRIILTLLLATVITTTVLGQDARPQRGQWGPQRQQLTEKQQEIGKLMAEDEGIKKIREKAIKDMIAYLVKKGYDKEDAKAVVENGAKAAERFRSGGGRGAWGNRNPGGATKIGPRGEGQRGPRGDRPQRN